MRFCILQMASHAYYKCNHIFIDVQVYFIYFLMCGRERLLVYVCERCFKESSLYNFTHMIYPFNIYTLTLTLNAVFVFSRWTDIKFLLYHYYILLVCILSSKSLPLKSDHLFLLTVQAFLHTVSDFEDKSRIHVLADTKEEFHLYMSQTMMSDNGQYRCLYKTK